MRFSSKTAPSNILPARAVWQQLWPVTIWEILLVFFFFLFLNPTTQFENPAAQT